MAVVRRKMTARAITTRWRWQTWLLSLSEQSGVERGLVGLGLLRSLSHALLTLLVFLGLEIVALLPFTTSTFENQITLVVRPHIACKDRRVSLRCHLLLILVCSKSSLVDSPSAQGEVRSDSRVVVS